jgi:protease I
MTEPREALDGAGAATSLVSPKADVVRGWNLTDWGDTFPVDLALADARSENFDALVLPGGVINPDQLRVMPEAVAFARAFFDAGKPVASICHGPWTIIETGAVRGRRLTSWPSLRSDLENAGASWVDEPVVIDRDLVTSRKPDDIPAFNQAVIGMFAEARAAMRPATA